MRSSTLQRKKKPGKPANKSARSELSDEGRNGNTNDRGTLPTRSKISLSWSAWAREEVGGRQSEFPH